MTTVTIRGVQEEMPNKLAARAALRLGRVGQLASLWACNRTSVSSSMGRYTVNSSYAHQSNTGGASLARVSRRGTRFLYCMDGPTSKISWAGDFRNRTQL